MATRSPRQHDHCTGYRAAAVAHSRDLALQTVQDLQIDLDVEQPHGSQAKLLKAVREFDSYLPANAGRIPTTANADAPARPSPPRSASRR